MRQRVKRSALSGKGADILMKGIINTDNLLHAILDKEKGLLPKGKILTHLAVMQIPTYDKLLFFSDAAVIPRPTLQQRIEMVWYAICTCRRFGIEQPRISLIHCTEKVSAKFPHSLDYVNIVELAEAGEFGNVIIDGPLDVRTSCEQASGDIKGIVSPINGQADVLIFPNIESANAFISLFHYLPRPIWQDCCKAPFVRWCYRHVVIPDFPSIIALRWHA